MERKKSIQPTNGEQLAEKKRLKQSKFFHAASIGFLAGIFIFGIVSWSLSSEKHLGFLIPLLIPVVFIYKALNKPKQT